MLISVLLWVRLVFHCEMTFMTWSAICAVIYFQSLFFCFFFSWQSSQYTHQLWWNFRIKQYTRATHFWDKQRMCFFTLKYHSWFRILFFFYLWLFWWKQLIYWKQFYGHDRVLLKLWQNFLEFSASMYA